MLSFIQNMGRTALNFLSALGQISLFSVIAIRWIFTPPYYWQQFFRQTLDIGYYSLPVVGLTTLFSGMVLALQSIPVLPGFRGRHGGNRCGVIGHARAWTGIGRFDGGWSHWCLNGSRDRHHARHRPDRRTRHIIYQTNAISGGTATVGRHIMLAVSGFDW
jgi:hypothetical protein